MSWRDVGFLVLGVFLGSNFGLLIYSLLFAARRGDELAHSSQLMADREKTGGGGRETGDGERRVVFERKVVISKRCVSPMKPTKKPSGPPPPPPPPGPGRAVNE